MILIEITTSLCHQTFLEVVENGIQILESLLVISYYAFILYIFVFLKEESTRNDTWQT
jgi:Ca2+/Na+ antiporter